MSYENIIVEFIGTKCERLLLMLSLSSHETHDIQWRKGAMIAENYCLMSLYV